MSKTKIIKKTTFCSDSKDKDNKTVGLSSKTVDLSSGAHYMNKKHHNETGAHKFLSAIKGVAGNIDDTYHITEYSSRVLSIIEAVRRIEQCGLKRNKKALNIYAGILEKIILAETEVNEQISINNFDLSDMAISKAVDLIMLADEADYDLYECLQEENSSSNTNNLKDTSLMYRLYVLIKTISEGKGHILSDGIYECLEEQRKEGRDNSKKTVILKRMYRLAEEFE